MKTDTLFYQLFQTLPDLFFELIGLTYSESYQFKAVELKQTAFRLDGFFVPETPELPVIFVEPVRCGEERTASIVRMILIDTVHFVHHILS